MNIFAEVATDNIDSLLPEIQREEDWLNERLADVFCGNVYASDAREFARAGVRLAHA